MARLRRAAPTPGFIRYGPARAGRLLRETRRRKGRADNAAVALLVRLRRTAPDSLVPLQPAHRGRATKHTKAAPKNTPMKMKCLELFRAGGYWHAAHFDEAGEPEQAIMDLFDTHVLPLPFTATAPVERVLADLQRRPLIEFYDVIADGDTINDAAARRE